MKKFSLIATVVAAVAALTVAASATSDPQVSINKVEDSGKIAINFDVVNTLPTQTMHASFTFDNSLFVPVEEDTTTVVADPATDLDDVWVVPYWAKKSAYFANADKNGSKYSVSGTKTTVVFDIWTNTVEDLEVTPMTVWFKYAEGKTADDIKSDSFVINELYYGDKDGNHSYNYECVDPIPLEVANNVVPLPVADPEIKVTDKVGIRSDSAATTGIRFVGNTATANKDTVKEYGFIAAIESTKSALPAGYVVDLDLVASGKAKKGVAFKKDETDIYYDIDGEDTILTCIVNGMPINPKAVKTTIAVRAYMILSDDKVVYSADTTKDTAYNVAYSVKAAGGEEYTENQEYIDSILAQDSSAEVPIDLSPLFE